MLYPLLSQWIRFPLLGYMLNGIYFGLIITGILVAAILFFRQMARAGYDKNRLQAFVVCSAVMVFPLGVISSRAANMFYFPPDQWKISFFIEQFFEGPHQTFHAALVLPLVFLLLLASRFQFEKRHLLDTLFLYVPAGHAFGRCGCFLVGCCWGNPIHFSVFEKSVSFHNPVPLYAILLNLLLFVFLKNQYNRIYAAGPGEKTFAGQGMITAFYLIGYGGFRIMLECIRTENVVGMGMTMAQWSMAFFVMAGMVILAATWYGNRHGQKRHS